MSAWFNEYGIVEQGGLFINLLDHFDEEGLKDSVVYYSKLKKQYSIISDPNYSYSGADSLTTQFELLLTAEFFPPAKMESNMETDGIVFLVIYQSSSLVVFSFNPNHTF